MQEYDLLIKGGRIATASDTFSADIGIKDEKSHASEPPSMGSANSCHRCNGKMGFAGRN